LIVKWKEVAGYISPVSNLHLVVCLLIQNKFTKGQRGLMPNSLFERTNNSLKDKLGN